MLTTMFLSALLMLGGLRGSAASDLQVHGKSIQWDKTLQRSDDGRHTVRRQPHQQAKGEIRRSLDVESYNVNMTPNTSKNSKSSLPTIIRLYPPTAKPLYLYANMPMRFGRESFPEEDKATSLTPNMPQRFGRFWEVIQMCAKCPDDREALNPELPLSFGRNSPNWSHLRTLYNTWLFNIGLHW
ncbi:pro-FMRFamide-related neuropeptide VF [Plectropomus leopardus]|uniref:pro-FMRFamide-related neuropeptide VF n=1 Tax=Plectropomus leopardus TaxID=160734 RepID=UPI001C4C9704|nr:pro-FMRFamide-related neuropeptide VF [Plectropomus leopardus]